MWTYISVNIYLSSCIIILHCKYYYSQDINLCKNQLNYIRAVMLSSRSVFDRFFPWIVKQNILFCLWERTCYIVGSKRKANNYYMHFAFILQVL